MIVIAIAGAVGSGKNAIAQKLIEYYGAHRCTTISQKNYAHAVSHSSIKDGTKQNRYCPDAFDFSLLASHLNELRSGQEYNISLDNSAVSQVTRIVPKDIVIVVGSLVLHAVAPVHLYDIKIYVDTDLDLCFSRILKRELLEFKHISEETLSSYEQNIKPIYSEYIAPTISIAQIIIQNNRPISNLDLTKTLDFIASETQEQGVHRDAPNIISPTFNITSVATQMPGTLFVISGPSGVGRSTILKRALQRPNIGVEKLVGFTTRPRRPAEIEGEDCHYISREEFQSMLDTTPFLQHIEGYGNHYGIPAPDVLGKLEHGASLIMDLTPEALRQVRQKVSNIISIFICPPAMTAIIERLQHRDGDAAETKKRYAHSINMLEQASFSGYDYLIINSDVDTATDALVSILSSKHSVLAYQQKENAILFKRFKIYSTLLKIKEAVLTDLDVDGCEIKSLASLSNSSYRLTNRETTYFLRVLRQSNDQYRILPEHEDRNLKRASELKLYPSVSFYDLQTGSYLVPFIEDHQLLSSEQLHTPFVLEDLVQAIHQLHSSEILQNDCAFIENAELNVIRLKQQGVVFPADMDRILIICHRVAELLKKTRQKMVPCHNDISPYNILYRQHDRHIIIADWECSGNNDPLWDIAKLSVEAHFNTEWDQELLLYYYGEMENVTAMTFSRFTLFKLMIELHLAMWAKWQSATKNDAATVSQFERMFSVRFDNCRKHIASSQFEGHIHLLRASIITAFQLPRMKFGYLQDSEPAIKMFSSKSLSGVSLQLPAELISRNLFFSAKAGQKSEHSDAQVIEQTLVILKPDVSSQNKVGEVIAFLEQHAFRVVAIKLKELTINDAKKLYSPKIETDAFRYDVLDLMTSGPVTIIVLEGLDAVTKLLRLKGNTNPRTAQEGTLRRLFGTDSKWNAVHCSDNSIEAEREIALFFQPEEIYSYARPGPDLITPKYTKGYFA